MSASAPGVYHRRSDRVKERNAQSWYTRSDPPTESGRGGAGKLEHVKTAPSLDHIDGIEDRGLSCSLDVKVGPDGAVNFSTMDTIYRWGS